MQMVSRFHYSQGNDLLCALYCAKTVVSYFRGNAYADTIRQADMIANNSFVESTIDIDAVRRTFQDQKGNSFFSIYALERTLETYGVVMHRLNFPDLTQTSEKVPSEIYDCFILNVKESHWKALIKYEEEWYDMDSLCSTPSKITTYSRHPLRWLESDFKGAESGAIFACFRCDDFIFDTTRFASLVDQGGIIIVRNPKQSYHKLENVQVPETVKTFLCDSSEEGVTSFCMPTHLKSDFITFIKHNDEFHLYPSQQTYKDHELIDIYSYLFSSYNGSINSKYIRLNNFEKSKEKSVSMKSKFEALLAESSTL